MNMTQLFKITVRMAFAGILCALWGCGNDDADSPTPPPVPDDPADIEEQTTRRTVLVYMVADNSLGRSGFDEDDLEEMRITDIPADCRLLVYHNRRGTAQGEAPRLLEITSEGDKVLKTYPDDPDIYSTDEARMVEVLDDVEAAAPATEPLGLMLWSHGSGWQTEQEARPVKRSFGNDRGRKMAVPTLAKALASHAPLAFLYFDCCHMTCVEVAYELRRHTPVIMGSLSELPAEGTRYDLVLPKLFAGDYEGATRTTFSYFDTKEDSEARTCTMSLIRTAPLDHLAAATRDVLSQGDPLPRPLSAYQPFMRKNNNLYDLGEYIKSLPSATPAWDAAMAEVVGYCAATPSIFNILDIKTFSGLGCFIVSTPAQASYYGYNELQWFADVVSHHPMFSE